MFSWFEKTAPIRSKFKVLLALHAFWGTLAIFGTYVAIQGMATTGLLLSLGGCAGAVATALISGKLICTPYEDTTRRMEWLADGDTETPIRYTDHEDCLGRMTKAMSSFRLSVQKEKDSTRTRQQIVDALGAGLEALASGNMAYTIAEPFAGDYDRLRLVFNRAVEGLERSLSQVATSARSVHNGSTEIRAASEDLARRTEQQAASLEETSAAMGQVTGMVADTASSAVEVRGAINAAHKDAADGGAVVQQAVSAMDAIEKSSQEISQIINVIDGIAFQTNLLALNAGVEAARAGDAGKGFAVVANEVRALAQRSADAAKDIKGLITTSSEQVSQGVGLVGETGKMLDRIVTKISEINALIVDIANGTETQSTNLQQVNSAVADMDKMTQQNAAMVEESTAAARSLAAEADELAALVARFQLRSAQAVRTSSPPAARQSTPRRTPAPSQARRPQITGNLAVKIDNDDDWTEF